MGITDNIETGADYVIRQWEQLDRKAVFDYLDDASRFLEQRAETIKKNNEYKNQYVKKYIKRLEKKLKLIDKEIIRIRQRWD